LGGISVFRVIRQTCAGHAMMTTYFTIRPATHRTPQWAITVQAGSRFME